MLWLPGRHRTWARHRHSHHAGASGGRTPYGGAAQHSRKIARLHQQETLSVTEEKNVRFSPSRDLDLSHYQPLRLHPNGMQFTAVNQDGDPVEDAVFYSTGGGFVSSEQELLHPEERDRETFPFPYESAEELLHMADERGCPLSSIVMANECAMLPEREVRENWT